MYQEDIHPRFQDTKIKKDLSTTTTTTSNSSSLSSSSSPKLCSSTSSLLVRPSLKNIRNTSSNQFLHPISTTTTTTSSSSSSSSIAFQRYSDFCDDCGIDVFRFCHEHWCKNFQ
ncbi:hypothetical protein INT45_007572 [Circinella minor]|uniref:Uncharacterized protein n=1 Tax=Circinella minor TaxID=1195481 RepID=A0A8H7S5V0_9FUNG|nr:hypothetical protein INT45_007572 [Circinella minor]